MKNKEAKLNELINFLTSLQRGVTVSDESLLAILKKNSIDSQMMESEEIEKCTIDKT